METLDVTGHSNEHTWLEIQRYSNTFKLWVIKRKYTRDMESNADYDDAIDRLYSLRSASPQTQYRLVSISITVLNY